MLNYIKDRFLRREIQKEEKEIKIGFTISGLLILILLANVAYLNLFIVKIASSKPVEPIAVIATPAVTPSPSQNPSSSPTPQPSLIISSPPPSQSGLAQAKDYYINLGSGTNQSTDWTDVPGTLNTFDIAQYLNIKEVHLETTTNVPTANGIISVRLFNKTDGYAVWNSDRTVQAQASGDLLISQNIIYDRGPKLYSVQMKSQLGVSASLIQARLHIIAQ